MIKFHVRASTFVALLLTSVLASQPSAPPPVAAPMRDLPWAQLNFLHTTDTHGWHAGHLQESQYSADWGDYISFAQRMREKADAQGVDVLLVDTGDRIEGNGLYDASNPKGEYTYNIVKEQDIDVICIGNHELYQATSAAQEYLQTVPNFKEKYIASNLDVLDPKTGDRVPLAQRFRKFTTKNQGIRVLAMGFLYNFAGNANNSFVQPVEKTVKEKWFQDAIRDKEVDLFVIIGHVDIRAPEFQVIWKEIRKANWDTPIQFFGGHRHVRDFRTFDSTAHAIASGRYMETIGFLSMDGLNSKSKTDSKELDILSKSLKVQRRYIDNNLFGLTYHTGLNETTYPTEHGKNVSKFIHEARKKLNLDHNFGCAPQDLWLNRAEYPSDNSILTWLEQQVLPDVVVDKNRSDIPRLAIINSGAMRFDVFKGPFTRDTTFIVSPFVSGFKFIKDVPYSAAKGVLELLNSGGPVFSSEITLENQHLAAPIPATYESEIAASSYNHKNTDQNQQQKPLRKEPKLLPGYTTHDDAGDDGDDTVHSPIKNYQTPNCVQAQIAFPPDKEPETVDLVFLEFITPWMLLALRFKGVQVGEGDILPYMAEKSFTELIAEWVQGHWGRDC